MCVLLRARPVLASAVVMGLNGDRFLSVYVAELGCELQVYTADIVPGPVEASWNSVTRCVLEDMPVHAAKCLVAMRACPVHSVGRAHV